MRAILSMVLFSVLGNAFGPRDMLSLPRRSAAVPNPDGTLALFTSSAYSFDTHNKDHGLWVIDITTGEADLIHDGEHVKDPAWLGFEDIICYLETDPETYQTTLWTTTSGVPFEKYKITTFAGPVTDLKLVTVDEKMVHFVVSGRAKSDGELHNPKAGPKQYAKGRVYTSLFARHWDEWLEEDNNALFAGHLVRASKSDRFTISQDYPLKNLLKGSDLESPVRPFGGNDDFDISPDGQWVAFVSKDPKTNPATNTASYVYAVPHDGSSKPIQVNHGGGASSSPAFSKDGKTLAFLQMDLNGYEADKNKIYLANTTPKDGHFTITQAAKKWDRSPKSVTWSRKSNYLYMVAEEHAREKVWKYSVIYAGSHIDKDGKADIPKAVTQEFSVGSIFTLGVSEWLLVSGSSLTSPRWYGLVNPNTGGSQLVSAAPENVAAMAKTKNEGQTIGTFSKFQRSQVGEFWSKGAGDYKVHSQVIVPSFFEEGRKYPLAFLIHGGPQSAWTDSWSWRWNPLTLAEQGYVVVTPNPTGSTGYGQNFTDGIKNQWGGRPYEDLVNVVKHIEENLDYVDMDRAVALGASYGGYMINWIQGMPLGRKFKALVCHDGVVNLLNQWASDELYFPNHDFGGSIFESRKNYEKWNPLNNVKHWSTPQMVIHSMKDFRLPISEGMMAYNLLQTADDGKGVDSKLLVYDEENHWVLNPENSLQWHEEVYDFINKYAEPEGWVKEMSYKKSESKVAESKGAQPEQKILVQEQEYL